MSVTTIPQIINGATSQYDRWLKALDIGYAPVDGRSFSDMLQFAVDFGGLINFFNLDDQVDGDWVDFYSSDPLVIIATIEAVNLDNIESQFFELIKQTQSTEQQEKKFLLLKDCFQFIFRLIKQINDWMACLDLAGLNTTRSNSDIELLKSDLEGIIIERLAPLSSQLNAYAKAASSSDALRRKIALENSSLLPIWKSEYLPSDNFTYLGNSPQQKMNHACEYLKPIFSEFYSAIQELKNIIPVQSSLVVNSNHRPQIALLMAFIRLYHKAQNTINTMSERYIRFYYDNVLRERKAKAKADSLYLNFTLANDEAVTSATVPDKTLFSAGLDENEEEIMYSADRSLSVTAASIERLKTLHLDRGKLYTKTSKTSRLNKQTTLVKQPELNPTQLATQEENTQGILNNSIKSSTLVTKRLITSNISIDEANNNPNFDWPIFGNSSVAEKTDGSNVDVSDLAQIGFAIATSYLWLSGGERQVFIDIQYTEDYQKSILDPLLQELVMVTGLTKEAILIRLLENAFVLYASSSKQWFQVEEYSICMPHKTGCSSVCKVIKTDQVNDVVEKELNGINIDDLGLSRTFRLCFILPKSAPPFVPYVPQESGEDGSDDEESGEPIYLDFGVSQTTQTLPMLLAYLRQQAVKFVSTDGTEISVYPLSLIDKMMVEKFHVTSHVNGLTELKISNTDGEVDPSSPFTVFGGLPVVGSYLEIYQQELFVKIPQELKINLEWFNIPQNDTGFKGYYRYYDIDIDGNIAPDLFDNQTFQGSFSLINRGIWDLQTTPYENKNSQLADQQVYLFSSITNPDTCIIPPKKTDPLCNTSLYANFEICASTLDYPDYYDPNESAIRLELRSPAYGFGNDIYAKNVLNAVIEDLPDTDGCRSNCLCEYRPINDAINCLTSCLENCLDKPEEDILACIKNKLLLGEAALFAATIQCLFDCLIKYNGVLDQEVYRKVEDQISRCLDLSSNHRVGAIEQCLNVLKKTTENYNQSIGKPCWTICIKYFEALKKLLQTSNCVSRCQSNSSEESKECLENCLQAGLEEMQVFYQLCLTECMDDCMDIETELKYPNEPYLPQAIDIKVDYSAECEIFNSTEYTSNSTDINNEIHYFHLLPFNGYREVNLNAKKAISLLASYSQSGNLYIGFSKLNQMQKLSLLFEMTESKGESLPGVRWDLLSENRWQGLSLNGIESDTTNGLQNTGVVSLDLPAIENKNNTILENRYYWLRASTQKLSNLYPKAHIIIPHVLTATRVMNQSELENANTDINTNSDLINLSEDTVLNLSDYSEQESSRLQRGAIEISNVVESSFERLVEPIPAHTITSSIDELSDIADIDQPIASFGGRNAESYRHFKIRLGERLRHKQRAIQSWDYERLVLEKFPVLWKVIALPDHNLLSRKKPGEVLLVVVIGSDSMNIQDPTTPYAPYDLLMQIQEYIQARASLFLKLHVTNPIYVRIAVNAEVNFCNAEEGIDNRDRLNNELIEYLSPWFYSEERESKAGDYACKDDITMFIQSRCYVDSLQSIELDYFPRLEKLGSDWCFLTSAKQHYITSAKVVNYKETEFCY